MGKPDGFLEIERKEAEKQPVDQRLKHFNEFTLEMSEEELRNQAARCMNCGVPFCFGYGCPVVNVIPEWNDLVYGGRWREAIDILHETNNFPEFTGRICPAPCEPACIAGIGGEPVTIRQIEHAIIERAWKEGWIDPEPPAVETGKRVAVIGSGPAGLSAAQQLRRAGHEVVVYERDEHAGGLLRFGIPDFKLEKWVIERRIRQMEEEGVKFQYEIDAGVDISAGFLKKKFDALCLCGGSMVPRDLNIPGREAEGIHFAMDFLTQQNRRKPGVQFENEIVADGKHVIVIGGGDTSNDCMGTALRQGALSVEQLEIMPEPPCARDTSRTPWPMWPYQIRISTSHHEGGGRQFAVNAKNFIVKNGKVTGVACDRVEWMCDTSGRTTFVPVAGSEFVMKADMVLLAMGFVHPRHEGLLDDLGVEYDNRGNVKVDDNMMSSVDGVFSAGDMASGAWLVVGAIAGGRRMANRVDRYLMGETLLPDTEPVPKIWV